MPPRTKTPKGPAPEFLKQKISKEIKEDMRKAYAMYLNEIEATPKEMMDKNTSIKQLHEYLSQLDPRWESIPTS